MSTRISSSIPGGRSAQPAPRCGGEPGYELRFEELCCSGRGYAFPCDADGHVDVDRLGSRARANYLHARAAIGREFLYPVILGFLGSKTG